MNNHTWHFMAVAEGEFTSAMVIVVCERCGLIRSATLSDARIELSGECPAAPDEPGDTVRGISVRI